jgi:L-ribulose-5-phosphate 3-epimerase
MAPITRRRALLQASSAVTAFAAGPLARALPLEKIRLGVTTDEIDEDLPTAIKFLKEFGLRYAEIRSVWGKYNTVQPVEKIREARAMLDEQGMRTSVLGTPFFKVPLPPDTAEGRQTLDAQWRLLDAAMERAAILGTDTLRIFAFTYSGDKAPDGAHQRIQTLLAEAGRRARTHKMRLAIENVGSSYISTGAEAASVLKGLPDRTVGLVWDPNNAGASGEKAPFPEGFGLLDKSRIMHVHLRDYKHDAATGKVVWCAVGDGEFDNLGQIRALLKGGYKGTFTLETHYKAPQGKAFATRTSLTALLKVIADV